MQIAHGQAELRPASTAPVELTPSKCREIASSLAASLTYFDVKPHPRSDLALMIVDLDWMADNGGLPIGSLGAAGIDKPRALHGLARLIQAQEVARVLQCCQAVRGAEKKVGHLASQLNRLRTMEKPAQATLFELDIAARLSRFLPDVTLADPPAPDVVCVIPGIGQLGFECKRPHRRGGLWRGLRDATSLIKRQTFPCFAIIDAQPLLYGTNDPIRQVYFDLLESQEDLKLHHGRSIRELIDSSAPELKRAFEGGVLGLCLCAMTWGFVSASSGKPGAYVYSWVAEWRTNGDSTVDEITRGLHQLLA